MQTIIEQFNTVLDKGIIPCFELEPVDGDFITVDISIDEQGIVFEFDTDNLPVYFSGNIERLSEIRYRMPFDEYFDSLDYYLQEIYVEVLEGFIIPNNIKLAE